MTGRFTNWKNLRHLPVAILGAGISGKAASALLAQLGWDYEIYDEQERVFTNEKARECSIVICSPGFKKDHPWRKIAQNYDKEIITETDFAVNFTESKIIAVTGTNGKTTLATFLTHLWKTRGKSALTAGNVGVPLSQLVADGLDSETTVFLETSSYQSEDLKYLRPEAVLWTNFDEDHLDYHQTEEKYFHAKSRLLELGTTDNLLIGGSVANFADKIDFDLPSQCRVVKRSEAEELRLNHECFLTTYPQLENIAIAYAFSQKAGIEREVFLQAMETYDPEPHRLQKIDTIGQATFWNDSKATNFSSALAACKNFEGNIFWIGGGKPKGCMIDEFAKKLRPLVKKVFLIGESGKTLSQIFRNEGFPSVWCSSLEEAVKKAFSAVTQKTTILLSPGFSSFDSFKDYTDRGNSFINIVLDLKKIASMATHNRIA